MYRCKQVNVRSELNNQHTYLPVPLNIVLQTEILTACDHSVESDELQPSFLVPERFWQCLAKLE